MQKLKYREAIPYLGEFFLESSSVYLNRKRYNICYYNFDWQKIQKFVLILCIIFSTVFEQQTFKILKNIVAKNNYFGCEISCK